MRWSKEILERDSNLGKKKQRVSTSGFVLVQLRYDVKGVFCRLLFDRANGSRLNGRKSWNMNSLH